MSATVEALSRSLNKRHCQNVILKEENERYKNEKERLYFLLKYRITQNDYLSKNTSSEIMTIVDKTKSLEKENIDLIKKYQDVLNILESERENCVKLLKFMFLKTFLSKYSNNNDSDNNSDKNSSHLTKDVSVLCKLENIENNYFSQDDFHLNEKLKSDLETISQYTPLSNLENLIIILIRLYKKKFLKEFEEKIVHSTVQFQSPLQLKSINKTLETNFLSLSLNSRCKSDISSRRRKYVTLSNCQIIRIVHSNRDIQQKISFPSKNIEYCNKNVNFGINENITATFENLKKWKEVSNNVIETLNNNNEKINYFEFYSLGIDTMWNIIYPMIKFDEIFTSKFHDSLIMNKLVGASLKFNQRKINNSPVDNEEKVVDFENFLPIEDSLIIEPVLNLQEFDSNLQESILNLKESEQKPVLNSEEPILNLEERVLNHQKSDSNLQNALNVEEKPIKIAKLESVTKAPNYIDGKKGKFMMNKSLSGIPIALSNVSKGLKKTREKNKIQAQKKDLKIKKEIDQVSNINCRKEKTVRSLSAERTSFSCQELKEISGNKNKMERRSKIPVRKKKIENMNMEKKDYIGDKKTNRITNVNLNPKVVENFNTEQEFKQEKEEEKSILESENIKIKNTKQIVETKFNYNEINNTETMKIKENEEKKLENDKFSLKSEIQKNVKVKNNEIEKTNLKMEKKTKRKNPEFLDVDYKNLDEEKRNDEEIKDQLSETLLLKRTNCSTLIDRNSFSLTTQILKRSNKTIKETNPPTKIVFISKISQESMPKIQLENQGNVEKQESQTSTIQELFEENFISKHKETKNHERREETSKTEFSKHNHSMINIKDIKAIIDSLLKSKIYQKKFIIVEGKKKLMKFADKKRKKKLSRKELNSEIKIIPQAKILKAENGNFKKSTNESMNTDWISRKESHFGKNIIENQMILVEDSKISPLKSIFIENEGNFETFEMLSENSLFDSENKNGAYWISQACSSSRQSNGGKEEKQLSNKVHSKEMKKKIKLNKIENCIGKSSIVNSVRGEEFIRGIQQSSSESSKRVSDCKAHSEDFDSRKCTQMSRDSGM